MRISLRHHWTLSNHNIQLKDQDWLFEHDTEVKKLLATNKLYLANILFIFQKREGQLRQKLHQDMLLKLVISIYDKLYMITGSLPKL